MRCEICPRNCIISDGGLGFCGVRTCKNGLISLKTFGKCTGLAVDPIEKKPFYHFLPGSKTLSLGGIGCNLACKFCQNYSTAHSRDISLLTSSATPEEVVEAANQNACDSVAFTYNEPIIWAEYALEIAKQCKDSGLKTLAVTNGYISDSFREKFFSIIDAVNVDLKSFSERFYREICDGSLEPVKQTLRYLAKKDDVLLEVTTLIIPTLNDTSEDILELSRWIRKYLGAETPLHFSAFHPAAEMMKLPRTPKQTLFLARDIALDAGLVYVYTGNIDDPAGQTTYCPQCNQAVITRDGYIPNTIENSRSDDHEALQRRACFESEARKMTRSGSKVIEINIDEDDCCKFCGQSVLIYRHH